MERGSNRSKRTDSSRRISEASRQPGPSEWEPSRHRDRDRMRNIDSHSSSLGDGRRGSRTAPSTPEPRRRADDPARSHSIDRPAPRRQEGARHSSPSQTRRHNRQDADRYEKRSRARDERSGGDSSRSHRPAGREHREGEQEFKEHQLGVYQKALKEQIVQSDHLIKAIYRFSDCIDMTEKAMRNLHDVMGDYWEDDWPSSEKYYVTLQDQEELWDRYEQSMRKLLDPIREYEDQFEGAEDKIEEYQSVRRQFSQACAALEDLRHRRAAGHDITFAESDRDRIGKRYEELVSFLGHGLPKIIASRIPFMEKLFYQLSNNLLQFCLETCKVQSKSCQILSKLRSYDLAVTLVDGRSRTTIRAPAREAPGILRGKPSGTTHGGKGSSSPSRRK
ncbi:amphiphysin-like isoform X2 [Pollicipes pollicipes]|uniref:amphiphysin-like isoform X2 n=1 Tax=Pollicipes pollicipes TaxID=41117 RepID=UPI0018849671|nr:amphiphysin-like isoform X2 [Pollicipes pollicipes]